MLAKLSRFLTYDVDGVLVSVAVSSEEKVLRLDVAIDQVLAVHVLHPRYLWRGGGRGGGEGRGRGREGRGEGRGWGNASVYKCTLHLLCDMHLKCHASIHC